MSNSTSNLVNSVLKFECETVFNPKNVILDWQSVDAMFEWLLFKTSCSNCEGTVSQLEEVNGSQSNFAAKN
jgi:hypothetical protein